LQKSEENVESESLKMVIDNTIDGNLKGVNIKTIAKNIGYSAVYTGVLIKKLTGLNYKDYLLERRLIKAEELLRNSTLSISEIIFAVGYENESYFRKKFIEKYGKKPLEYKRSFKK
jgi:YesN/AraC family two-component response regulator